MRYFFSVTPKILGRIEERQLLSFSSDDMDAALRILRDLSHQLKKLQRGADRRRSRVQDQFRASLVRYVKRKTGKLHDRLVCDLLEVALAPPPDIYQIGVDETEVDPDHTWEEVNVESHRRWRGRNKKLIDKPSALQEQWEQGWEWVAKWRRYPAEPTPQMLWPPEPMRRKSR